MRFKDKVVLVTGSGHGLGAFYAERFATEGGRVAVADIDKEAVVREVLRIEASGGNALGCWVDISDETSVSAMVKKVLDSFGRIDILVNNAAIMLRFPEKPLKPFNEYTTDEWDKIMAVNVRGTWLCSKAVFLPMKSQGGGKIINVASNVVFQGEPVPWVPYITSKGAIIAFTRALAKEVGQYGINVNAVAPGMTHTETVLEQMGNDTDFVVQRQSIKKKAYPEDIVGAVLFLASSESDFISGQTLVVDGGMVVH